MERAKIKDNATKTAKWFGRQLKASAQKRKHLKDRLKPKCPYCGSLNNNLPDPVKSYLQRSANASKKFGAGLTVPIATPFVGNKKPGMPENGECFDCGRKWRI